VGVVRYRVAWDVGSDFERLGISGYTAEVDECGALNTGH
jgi:hypothetical protein